MARSKLTLQDVARAASDRNGGKGGRALQRIAKSKGLTLSYATVDRILAGKYESTPQRQTIEALAVLAEMPADEVYEAAGLPLPMASLAEQLPDGSDQLTVHQRRVVLDVIRGFVRDNARMADLEHELHQRPLHPNEMRRRLNELSIPDMDTEALHELLDQLALLIPDDADEGIFVRAEARAREVLERREAGGSGVEDPAQPDGVTAGASTALPRSAGQAALARFRSIDLRKMPAAELRDLIQEIESISSAVDGRLEYELVNAVGLGYAELLRRKTAEREQLDGMSQKEDFARAADDSGPSLLEADDARAARRGEESQDSGSDEPA